MNNQKMTNEEFLDFYVQYCAARTDDRFNFPPETGSTDDWVNERMKKYTDKMNNQEFLDFVEKIKHIAKEKYKNYSNTGYLIFGIVQEAILWRDTIKYSKKHPGSSATLIDLSDEEENQLVRIIEELRDSLPAPHKYRANDLIQNIKGEDLSAVY